MRELFVQLPLSSGERIPSNNPWPKFVEIADTFACSTSCVENRLQINHTPPLFFSCSLMFEMVLNCSKWTNTDWHEMQWCFCLKFLFSSAGREGFHSVESIVSQQMSLSIGDDSTGSWSNLSFEDEHPDESSSFLHLSDRWVSVVKQLSWRQITWHQLVFSWGLEEKRLFCLQHSFLLKMALILCLCFLTKCCYPWMFILYTRKYVECTLSLMSRSQHQVKLFIYNWGISKRCRHFKHSHRVTYNLNVLFVSWAWKY